MHFNLDLIRAVLCSRRLFAPFAYKHQRVMRPGERIKVEGQRDATAQANGNESRTAQQRRRIFLRPSDWGWARIITENFDASKIRF